MNTINSNLSSGSPSPQKHCTKKFIHPWCLQKIETICRKRNPPLVLYRRPLNQRTLLVQATFKQKHHLSYKGNSQCQQTHKTCDHIKPIKRFKSSVTRKTYSIKALAKCKTANTVYVIECTKCNKQYVGEMENVLHIQMNGH